ncbi:unnamed protein product [Adineta steineri]|uniref:Uncharacterized protein n=1 Tax=Adineta steineri TaxID=433720 RepID=A0A819SH52_9BILA|nr:unnamed protein product [Adineta steineri]
MSVSSTIWLITVDWVDSSCVDFLVRSFENSKTKLDVYHWFFAHIHDVILRFDYSPLNNIEGDLDLMQILNKDIDHELLNINDFEDFLEFNLTDIEQYMRENGQAHGMVVTVTEAKEQNYKTIIIDNNLSSTLWKVTYNIRPLTCLPHTKLPNLFDIQQSTRSISLWQLYADNEHHVYQYIFKHLDQFRISNLPTLMNKKQEELIQMVEFPLEQTEYRIISEMINIQCCNIAGEHEHDVNEAERYVILVEPALNLLNIIDI